MPNHYDIDVHCRKCGGYLYTIYPDDNIDNRDDICDICKHKAKKPPKKC